MRTVTVGDVVLGDLGNLTTLSRQLLLMFIRESIQRVRLESGRASLSHHLRLHCDVSTIVCRYPA